MARFLRRRKRQDDPYADGTYDTGQGWNQVDSTPLGRCAPGALLAAGLAGALLACAVLFVLFRWAWTRQFLYPVFVGHDAPAPALTAARGVSVSPTPAAISVTPPPTVPLATMSSTRQLIDRETSSAAGVRAIDVEDLEQLMLSLVNRDRRDNGLSQLAWDACAANAGRSHAQEMASKAYISHWNLMGHDPIHRYSLSGGLDAVRENVYYYWHSPGGGLQTTQAWEELIRQAQQSLMQSLGHRDNILAPEHTHVGIGIAYSPTNSWLAIAQEFIDRYVVLEPVPQRVSVGDAVQVRGRLADGASNPLINLAFEPFPTPMTIDELEKTGTHNSAAEFYQYLPLTITAAGQFEQATSLDHQGRAGLYHIRIWVDTTWGEVLAADIVVQVQNAG